MASALLLAMIIAAQVFAVVARVILKKVIYVMSVYITRRVNNEILCVL